MLSTLAFAAIGFADDYIKVVQKRSLGLTSRQKLLQFTGQRCVAIALLACAERRVLHAADGAVRQGHPARPDHGQPWAHPASALASGLPSLRALRDARHHRLQQRREPHRRPRRPRHRLHHHRRRRAHRADLRQRPRGLQRLPRAPAHAHGQRADRLLRRDGRREHRLPLVQRAPGGDLHGRRRLAALGGAIATVAVIIKQELLLPFIGGVFILEALSVILQVGSYKLRNGKRIFKMAPLHHHFELLGWSESKVIARFWIMALVFALFALTTLKLRLGNRLGIASIAFLVLAALCPVLNFVLLTYILFGVSLVCSIGAGFVGSRKWFILAAVLAFASIVFLVLVLMILQGSRVGA
jgi:hypothetical protein